jgi:hypothetical protein
MRSGILPGFITADSSTGRDATAIRQAGRPPLRVRAPLRQGARATDPKNPVPKILDNWSQNCQYVQRSNFNEEREFRAGSHIHHPTGTCAGRVPAPAIVREMKANSDFQRDFAQARAEIAAAQTAKNSNY